MGMTVKINAVDRTQYVDAKSLSINDEVTDKVNTASFEFICQDVALAPAAGETVLIEENSTKLFSGRVLSKDESFLPPNLLRYSVECIDHTRDLDKRLVSESYVNQLAGDIIKDIVNKYTTYWELPTSSYNPPEGGWYSESNAYDNNLSTYAWNEIQPLSWSDFLELYIDEIPCNKIRFFAGSLVAPEINEIDIDVYYGGDWHHVYQGIFTSFTWEEESLGGNYLVTKAKVRFYNSHSSFVRLARFHEFNFCISVFTTTNVSDGPTISEIAFDFVQVSDAITKIAEICGYEWYVDYDKDIYFFFKTDYPAPFQLDDNQTDYKDLIIDTDISQIRNRIYVKSSSIEDTFGEVFIGDGITESWDCKYKAEIMLPTALDTDILRWRGNAVEFSNSDVYLAVGLDWVFTMPDCPDIRIFKRDGDTFAKLPDPDTKPTGNAYGVSWSSDDVYLAIGHEYSPRITIYKRDEDTFTKLDNPAILPTGNGNGLDFGYNDTYLAIAHYTTPYITIYKRAADVFTKLDNPASLPTGTGYDAAFSPDGTYLAVVHATTPYLTIYKRAGDVFTKLANPADLPVGDALDVAFSPDGVYLAVGHTSSPYITIYKRSEDTFTKLANPASLPTGRVTGVAFAPNTTHLATTHDDSPYITLYKRGGDTFVKVADPSPLPTGDGLSVAFSYGNIYLAVGHKTDPRLTIYKHYVPLIKVDGIYKTIGWDGIDNPDYFDYMLNTDTKVLSLGTIAIDVGGEAIDRPSTFGNNATFIIKENPSNADGVIDTIEIWADTSLTDCEVAIFYRPDPDNYPNKFTVRSSHNIGAVIAGAKRTFPGLNLQVKKGDFLGGFYPTGIMEAALTGLGVWYEAGDHIPSTNKTYTQFADITLSLYAIGTLTPPAEDVELFLIYTVLGVPICFKRDDKDSIADRIEKEGGDGIIEFCIVDNNINSLEWANEATKADLLQNADPTVNATFTTNRSDIHSGQIITLNSTKRNINQQFILQKVELIRVDTGGASIVYAYQVTIANKFKKLEDLFLHLLTKTDVRLIGGVGGAGVAAGEGVYTFLGLTDTPGNYTGDADKFLSVSPGEDAVEFVTPQANEIEIAEIGASTYDDVQAWLNNTQSGGRISGGVISDDSLGGITISSGTGFIQITTGDIGLTKSFNWSADAIVSAGLTDNSANYIYMDYNAGSPIVKATATRGDIHLGDHFTLGRVYKSGTDLHILQSGVNIYNAIRRNHERLVAVRNFERASGGVVSETGVRYLTVTAGIFYLGGNKITTTAQDTSGADRFTSHYYISGAWASSTGQQQIDNLRYNDTATAQLETLTANRYGVHWVYIHFESDIHVVYGQGDYKLSQAENAVVPDNLPSMVEDFGTLVAKIIIQKNSTNFTSIVTAYKELFPVSSPPDHNDLGGIQGGTADEYYHLTNSQHSELHTQNTDTVLDMSALLTSDHTYSGLRDYQIVGESVVFGDLLYFNWTDKEWKKTDADAAATMPGLRIALQDKPDGQYCNMLVKGYIRDDSAFAFAGAMVYASVTPGAMSSTAPTETGDQVQRVGVAKSADILFFDPSIDVGEI